VVTAAFWDRELIELPQSSNLTLTCSVVGASRDDIIRLVHSYRAKTLLLADNDVIGPNFSRLGRYHVTYRHDAGTALVTVNVNGQSHRSTDRSNYQCRFQKPNTTEHYCRLMIMYIEIYAQLFDVLLFYLLRFNS